MATGAELTYQTNATALQMANNTFGDGVTVTSASYSGPANSSAIYSNGQLSQGVVPSNTGVILSTGNAASFTQSSGDPNRSTGTSTNTTGTDNNAAFNAIAGTNTFDAVWLDVNFIPIGSVMTIQFVISSEEYPEYISSQYNDVIGVWVNGVHVPISIGTGVSGITNINGATQPNLFVSNTNDQFNTEMDGFTLTLSLTIPVNSGVSNSIRFGVADAADASFDTNLLIAADSVQTVLVAKDDTINMQPNETETVNILGNDSYTAGTLTITHINGQPILAGQTITLALGQQIKLNANGTITLIGNGLTQSSGFTYTVKDGLGHTGTAQVMINSVPCFVAGTLIETPEGEVPVESLQAGDLVITKDDGPQPLRWIERRVVVQQGGEVEYVHLMFDSHRVVFSEGLASESFLSGPHMTQPFEQESLCEICTVFPELDPQSCAGYSPAIRRTLKGFEAQVWRARSGLAA